MASLDLLKVKRYSLVMMQDRGFDITHDADFQTNPDIGSTLSSDPVLRRKELSSWYLSADRLAIVEFMTRLESGQQHISSTNIKDLLPRIQELQAKYPSHQLELIIIGDSDLNPNMIKSIETLMVPYQYFEEKELTYNPTQHKRNPKYTRLSPEAAEIKRQELKVTATGNNSMLTSDPISKWYWYQAGDLIKESRDLTEINSAFRVQTNWRTVVNG